MFLLHLTHPSGRAQTMTFPSATARGLFMITIAAQPVCLRTEDVLPVVDVALVPTAPDARGPIVEVALVPKAQGDRR